MKNKTVMIMIMIIPGMTIILTTLILAVALAVVAGNERLAINLTVLIKSINGMARGKVKEVFICVYVASLVTCVYFIKDFIQVLYTIIYFCIHSFTVHGGEKVRQGARQKGRQKTTQLQKR